ncbi:MAG TPA: hypothetical protein VGQ83_26550 [Polyangia bacterium]
MLIAPLLAALGACSAPVRSDGGRGLLATGAAAPDVSAVDVDPAVHADEVLADAARLR